MKKVKLEKRFSCFFCGSKRYKKFLDVGYYDFEKKYFCKNNNLCQLKMSYNKKKKKI